jgi:transcriptional regulator with XRE-family HTH domain
MRYRTALGHVLRTVRVEQDRTLRSVCGKHMSISHLSSVERGRQEISSEMLEQVCERLGVKVSMVVSQASQVLERAEA